MIEINNNRHTTQAISFKKKSLIISISKKDLSMWIKIIFLVLPHFNPGYLNMLGIVGTIFDGIRVLSIFVAIMLLFANRIIPSKITIFIIVQRLFLVILTLINGEEIRDIILEMGSVIAVLLLYEYFLRVSSWRVYLSALLFCFELMIYINLITIILYPHGMYWTNGYRDTFFVSWRCWFLGYYNNLTQFLIPGYMFALLYIYETGKRLRSYLFILSMFFSAYLLKSGGVVVSLLSITLIWLFFKNRTLLFNYYTYWMSQIVFISIALSIGLNTKLLYWILENMLGKTESFLGRVRLWEKYAKQIFMNPIFGYGIPNLAIRKKISGMSWGTHAHNFVLETLYRGGIVNLLLWMTIVILAGRKIYKYRDNRICKIIAACFGGWCVDSFVEPFMTPFLMGMFVIAYYVGTSVDNSYCKNEEIEKAKKIDCLPIASINTVKVI